VLSIEDIFYARNVRTTVVLGHARGVILLAAAQAGLQIHEFPPAEIKKAVAGTGAATKLQVQFMVAQLLRLKSAPQPTDAADGVAAALCYALAPDLPAIMSVVPPLRQLARQAEAAALADIPGRVIGAPPR
jgi:crossover junction endodeoxyribonuclease RuvC